MPPPPWIQNQWFNISTPEQAPTTFRGFVWLAAIATCRKCGRSHTQTLRIHQVQLPSFEAGNAAIIHKPMPSDEKIAAQFSLVVAENGVGCWRTCRPWKHNKVCACPGECVCPRSTHCVCPKGCGNRGVYPCEDRCGRMFGKVENCVRVGGWHALNCETGLVRRDSSYAVEAMRSSMTRRK